MRRLANPLNLTRLLFFLFLLFAFLAVSSKAHAANYSITGKVTDSEGHPIMGSVLDYFNATTGQLYASDGNYLNNDGTYRYAALPEGIYNIRIRPAEAQGYLQKTFSNIVVNQNLTNYNFILDPAPGSVVFTGTLKTPLNQPVDKISVSLTYPSFHNPHISISTSAFTDTQGVFYFRVFPRSDYDLLVAGSRGSNQPTLDMPSNVNFNINPFSLLQNLNQDIIIPTQHITVHVQNPNGTPTVNASVSPTEAETTFYLPNIGTAIGKSGDGKNTDVNGNTILRYLPSGPNPTEFTINVSPNSGPYFDSRLITNEEIIEGKIFNLTLSTLPTLKGFVSYGNPLITNMPIELKQNNTVVATTYTDSKGAYYLKIPLGNYQIRTWSDTKIPNGPESFEISGDLALTQSKQISFSLGNYLAPIGVIVKNANSNVGIPATVSSQGPDLALSVFGLTNVVGHSNDTVTASLDIENRVVARLRLFKTGSSILNPGYTINITPTNTNFLPNRITNFKFDGGVETTVLIQTNQPPVASAGGSYIVNEGSSVALQGSATDPDNDQLTYSWDLDNNGIFETSGQNATFSASLLDGPSSNTVALKVCDIHEACDTDIAEVIINNIAPVNLSIVPLEAVLPYTVINANAVFEDVGVNDVHTAIWDWGDNSSSAGTVVENNGSGAVTGSHSYATPGIYTVTLTVNDGTDTSSQSSIIIIMTPSEATQDLVEVVLTLNLQQGIQNNLDAKLDSALNALNDVNTNNDQASINSLTAFINSVEAQRGIKITDAQADMLIAEAQKIIQYLNL